MSFRILVVGVSLCCAAGAQHCGDEAQFRKRFDEKEALRQQYWQAKQFDKAAGVLEELRRDVCFGQFPEYQSGVLYNLACAYSLAGKKAEAVAAQHRLTPTTKMRKDIPTLRRLLDGDLNPGGTGDIRQTSGGAAQNVYRSDICIQRGLLRWAVISPKRGWRRYPATPVSTKET